MTRNLRQQFGTVCGDGIKNIVIKVASNSVPSPPRRQRSNAGSHPPLTRQVVDLTQNIVRVLQYIENQEHRANSNPPPQVEERLQNDLKDTLQDNNNSSQRVRQKSNPTKSARRVDVSLKGYI